MQANLDHVFQGIHSSPAWTPDWMKNIRKTAFSKFLEQGFPDRKQEDWKYTSIKAIAEGRYQWSDDKPLHTGKALDDFIIPEAQLLVFLNGSFAEHLSKFTQELGLSILPMEQALLEEKDEQSRLHLQHKGPHSSLEELNQALMNSGTFIRIDSNSNVKHLIQLLYINDKDSFTRVISPRNIVELAENVEATVVESYFSFIEPHFTNVVSDYRVSSGAQLQVFQEKILSSDSMHISSSHIHLEKDAQAETFTLSLGGKISRSQLQVYLKDEGAQLQIDGLSIGRLQSHIDHTTKVEHQAAHTRSSQVYKAILYDNCRAVFNGQINIAKNAQQTQALQLNKNLLMSDSAEADTRPQLRIDADDVKCTHGATVGQLDPMQVFYLQSRGIAKDEAEQILAKAFIRDVVYRIKNPSMRARILKLLNNYSGLTL